MFSCISNGHRMACLTLMFVTGSALAQGAGAVRLAADSAMLASDPNTPVAPVSYQSPFQALPQGVEAEVLDWKKSNALVTRTPRKVTPPTPSKP